MAEVLGVVSAATQLATLCCSLLGLLKKIKAGPSTLQSYQAQLQDISLLSTSIAHNPLLQTLEIESLTQSLLALLSKADLSSVLQKHKIFRILYLLFKEQDLLDTLSAVERQKLSLCLSIEQIQSIALYEIRTDIQSMTFEKQNTAKKRIAANILSEQTQVVLAGSVPARRRNSIDETTIAEIPEPVKDFSESSLVKRDTNNMQAQGIIHDVQYIGSGEQKVGTTFFGPTSHLVNSSNTMEISDVKLFGTGKQTVETNICTTEDPPAGLDFGRLLGKICRVSKDESGVQASNTPGPSSEVVGQSVGITYTVIKNEDYSREAKRRM